MDRMFSNNMNVYRLHRIETDQSFHQFVGGIYDGGRRMGDTPDLHTLPNGHNS
jgi:hypothetical protein